MTVIPFPARSPPVVAAGMGSKRFALPTTTTSLAAKAVVDWVKATDVEFFNNGDSRPIMLFDGVCNLCNGGVRFVRENDYHRRIRFEALQTESGRKLLQRSGRSPDDISSVVLVEKDRSYIKSEAVLKIMEYLDLPFPQLALLLKMEFDRRYGPGWQCVVGSNFGCFFTHREGTFIYFCLETLYFLIFKAAAAAAAAATPEPASTLSAASSYRAAAA